MAAPIRARIVDDGAIKSINADQKMHSGNIAGKAAVS
jgi:hypothetical protein